MRERFLEDMRLNGEATCPCCDRFAKIYRRKINSGMARDLIRLYGLGGRSHANALGTNGSEISKCRFWGLVYEVGEKHSGIWQITTQGENFIKGITTVPKYMKIFLNTCVGLEGDPITIKDALGSKFNYEELMRGI